MTALILAFLISFVFCAKCAAQGIFTIKNGNVSGGVFVIVLSLTALFLTLRYVIKA